MSNISHETAFTGSKMTQKRKKRLCYGNTWLSIWEKSGDRKNTTQPHNGTNEFTLDIFPLFVDPGYKKT